MPLIVSITDQIGLVFKEWLFPKLAISAILYVNLIDQLHIESVSFLDESNDGKEAINKAEVTSQIRHDLVIRRDG